MSFDSDSHAVAAAPGSALKTDGGSILFQLLLGVAYVLGCWTIAFGHPPTYVVVP